MTYLGQMPVEPLREYTHYNLLENSNNLYSVENNDLNSESYFKEDTWLKVYVARCVGKADINTLTVEDYKKIDRLILPNKQISVIPYEIVFMSNLKQIDLSGNNIVDVPNSIEYLYNLEKLDLSNNEIKSFSSSIVSISKSCTKLKSIDLSDNFLIFDLENINEVAPGVIVNVSQNPIDGVHGKKQIILSGLSEFHFRVEDSLDIIKNTIISNIKVYNTLTGEIKNLPNELEVDMSISDLGAFDNGVALREGNYLVNMSLRNNKVISRTTNNSIVVSDVPVTIYPKDVESVMPTAQENFSVVTQNQVVQEYVQKLVKVSKSKISLFEQPNVSSQNMLYLEYGKELKVVDEEGDFYKIEYNTYTGYVQKADIEECLYSLKEVIISKANVYVDKKLDSTIYATIPKNQLVKVYATSGGEWSSVFYNNKVMYMKTENLGDTITYVGEIIVDKAKVRETPSDMANAIGMMSKGDRVEAYEMVNANWYKIKYINKTAYVKATDINITSQIKVPGETQGTIIQNNQANITENSNSVINQGITEKPKTGDDMSLDLLIGASSLFAISLVNKKKVVDTKSENEEEN